MALWHGTSDDTERDEIVADIQESIDEYRDAPPAPLKKPYIKFEKLGDVAEQVMVKKAKLRDIIDRHGGVSAVAQKTGIPQPSLSRMLNSPSMPRKSTLYRIANALNLPETEIVSEWSR
jgi:DNA-binding phage protein